MHGFAEQGAVPSTQPCVALTNVVEYGVNPRGTAPPAGPVNDGLDPAEVGAGERADVLELEFELGEAGTVGLVLAVWPEDPVHATSATDPTANPAITFVAIQCTKASLPEQGMTDVPTSYP